MQNRLKLCFSLFLIFLILGLPLFFGFFHTFLPAFGFAPYLEKHSFTFFYILEILNTKYIYKALLLSFLTGFFAALTSWYMTFLFGAVFYQTKVWNFFKKYISIFLAYPHLAFGIGFSLLFASSGIFSRFLAKIFDWQNPPNWIGVPDPYGISLYLGLVLRETPFLIFLMFGILSRGNYEKYFLISNLAGYSNFKTWQYIIWDQISKKLYLPFVIILVYGLSCIDMALVLGPSLPPTFSILILDFMKEAILEKRFLGSAAIILLLGLILFSIFLFFMFKKLSDAFWKSRRLGGKRSFPLIYEKLQIYFCKYFLFSFYTLFFLIIFINFIWSFVKSWYYPFFLPEFTWKYWLDYNWWDTFLNSFFLAFVCSLVSIFFSVLILEFIKDTNKKVQNWINSFLFAPFFLPEIALVFGFYIFFLQINLSSSYFSIFWAHLIFVFPYVFLTLQGAYLGFDKRYWQISLLLNKSKFQTLLKIKIPILILPICLSFAVGFSVSIGQYLTSYLIGEGRIVTLATEALIYSSGGNRRIMGLYSTLQSFLPFLIFLFAFVPYFLQQRKFKNYSR